MKNYILIFIVVLIIILVLRKKAQDKTAGDAKTSNGLKDAVTKITNTPPQYFPVPIPPVGSGGFVVVTTQAANNPIMQTNVFNQKSPVTGS